MSLLETSFDFFLISDQNESQYSFIEQQKLPLKWLKIALVSYFCSSLCVNISHLERTDQILIQHTSIQLKCCSKDTKN